MQAQQTASFQQQIYVANVGDESPALPTHLSERKSMFVQEMAMMADRLGEQSGNQAWTVSGAQMHQLGLVD